MDKLKHHPASNFRTNVNIIDDGVNTLYVLSILHNQLMIFIDTGYVKSRDDTKSDNEILTILTTKALHNFSSMLENSTIEIDLPDSKAHVKDSGTWDREKRLWFTEFNGKRVYEKINNED